MKNMKYLNRIKIQNAFKFSINRDLSSIKNNLWTNNASILFENKFRFTYF